MFAGPGRDNGTEKGISTVRLLSLFQSAYLVHTTVIKKAETSFADKDPSSQSYGFSSHHIWM